MRTQKIIIADNNKYFRKGLKTILQNIGNVEIVAEVSNAFSLLNALESKRVDVVFTELELPVVNGIEIIRIGHHKYPNIKFIAFSSLENNRYVNEIMAAGAFDYLFKSNDNYDALNNIVNGENQELTRPVELNFSTSLVENTMVN